MSNTTAVNASSAPYQYERLTSDSDEIRLVQITGVQEDPADEDSIVLELDIRHTPLDAAGPYLAISYAWGNPARTHKLLVNGAALFVPENTFQTLYTVYHALPTLATELCVPGEHVSLWIDAVSLNQSHVKEKDEQVRRMGQIYSQAAGTIGYIGRPPEGKNPFDGFRTLLWMGNDVGITIPDHVPVSAAYAWFGEPSRDPDRFEQEVGPIAEFAEAYKDLFASDWFIRCWVVQEMALSREIACLYGYGSDFAVMNLSVLTQLLRRSRTLENFQHFAAIFSATNHDAETSWARIAKEYHLDAWSSIRNDLQQGQSEGLRLLELLERARFGKVTDPRDRVYSLLGMMKEENRSAIRVDYSGDYTPANLFLDIAAHCIGSHDCYVLLGWAGLRLDHHFSELPSWVPDWSAPILSPLVARRLFSASGKLSHPLTVLDGGRTISAWGIPVDSITFLTPPMASADEPARADVVRVLRFAAQLCNRIQRVAMATKSHAHGTYHFSNEPWHDVMWRTCCMDSQTNPLRRASLDVRPSFVACLRRYGLGADPLETVALDEVGEMVTNLDDARLEEVSRGFELGVLFAQRERVFGMTGRKGLIGSFPEATRMGDLVAVLLGGELPVVLRPLDGVKTGFELVGMCYVHGIMDGEWITHVTGDHVEDSEVFQEFVIH